MTFIDAYEEQLVEAARRQRDERQSRRLGRLSRLRLPRGRGAAVALAALLIGVPAAAAVTGFNPFDDPGRNPRLPAPSTSQGPVDPELAATLGVLRRSQTGADRGASVTRAARAFSATGGYRGAQVGGIRVLDPGREIVLIPFARGPVPLDSEGHPVPGFDPAMYTNVACLFEPTGNGVGGVGCHTAAKIRSGRAIATESGRVTGLVPDGVARVRLVRGGQATEAAVANNLFVADAEPPQRVDWLSEDGALVRRINLAAAPPTP